LKKIGIFSPWQFGFGSKNIESGNTESPREYLPGSWYPGEVPGDINLSLLKQGMIPDPHFGDNGRKSEWITEKDWWYRTSFPNPGKAGTPIDLTFDYLDGIALIFLNGQNIGRGENAFHSHRFKAENLLNQGKNELLVCFPSINGILGGPREDDRAGWKKRRVLIRKPQFSFGWDWSLPLPSIGMGTVSLETHCDLKFTKVTHKTSNSGRIDFFFEVTPAVKESGYTIRIAVESPDSSAVERELSPQGYCSHISMTMPEVKLWYPADYGEQPLYRYRVELVAGDSVVDSRNDFFVFREIGIREEPFETGSHEGFSFLLEINSIPVFCKGSNWVPLSFQPFLAGREKYRFYLEKAAEAGFNMLRVWGGGIYEDDFFYEECARLGIMVWQDFMFASSGYPARAYSDNIIREAEYQLNRLRGKVILWCGCNEDVYSWSHPFDQQPDLWRGGSEDTSEKKQSAEGSVSIGKQTDELSPGERGELVNRLVEDPFLYSMLLRGLTGKVSPETPYIRSSPASYEDGGNEPHSGNSHLSSWKYALFTSPEHPENFRDHFKTICSFDSEFCVQGPCSLESFRKFMPKEHLWPPDEVWTYHIQRGHANIPHHEQTLAIAGGIFGPIEDLETYIKHGQTAHAEMTRVEYEYARYDWPKSGGTMSWMFNDCWPTANWSVIDFYRNPKPSYYAAKRACAPVLPIIAARDGIIRFAVSNNTNAACYAQVEFGQSSLNELSWQGMKCQIEVEPGSTTEIYRKDLSEYSLSSEDFLLLKVEIENQDNNSKIPAVSWFPSWRDVPWPDPGLSLTKVHSSRTERGNWRSLLKIETRNYARFIHIKYQNDKNNGSTWFSDNYFDMVPNSSKLISVITPEKPGKADSFRVGWWGDWLR